MTLDLLWQEYKGEHPDGYQYSSFATTWAWAGRLSVSLRQTHVPGGETVCRLRRPDRAGHRPADR
ncbi:MAG: hypothetical protein IPH54_16985 [Rhodoferax sp.]|nr:hypothetical protein [Rhodoferax sp.]